MTDRELEDLQDPEAWDFETSEQLPPMKSAGAVVPVRFPREEFELVAEYAERAGQGLSDFIREAAVDRATHRKMD